MVAVFHKVFLDQITFTQQPTEQSPFPSNGEATAPMNAVDVVAELVSGKNTCEELGQQALSFFKVLPPGESHLLCEHVGMLFGFSLSGDITT